MDIRNKRVMIFGGSGLTGSAICRKLISQKPAKLVICARHEEESLNTVDELELEFPDSNTELVSESGNLFVPWDMRHSTYQEIINDKEARAQLLEDVLLPVNDNMLKASFVYKALDYHRPDILVDAVDLAGALSDKDIYSSGREVLDAFDEYEEERDLPRLRAVVEKNLCVSYVPQLVKHVQILHSSMVEMGTAQYIKIGTSGTGGMGLNIPYTHSEGRPSRGLLSRSSIAGAHSLLLFLMARTPGGPIIKEFMPTAAISWKSIQHGLISKDGKPVRLYDMPVDMALDLESKFAVEASDELKSFFSSQDDEYLEDVYINSGGNESFSMAEFTALTSIGQMEFITPEEIADSAIYEIMGGNTGHDVINALDEASMGPTYRAGVMRESALKKLELLTVQHESPSVAFETLGPPRLSKLLYEAHLIKLVAGSVDEVLSMSAEDISGAILKLIDSNSQLRKRILSIGIPILLPDGNRLLRGLHVNIPSATGNVNIEFEDSLRDSWAFDGWVDLRISNFLTWKNRFNLINKELDKIPYNDTSSRYSYDRNYWQKDKPLNEGRIVAWIFRVEDNGARMKS